MSIEGAQGMAYQDRIYHGIYKVEEDKDGAQAFYRVLVEEPEEAEAGRENARVRYELTAPSEGGQFTWGYYGTGPNNSAAAILADALDIDNPRQAGIAVDSSPADEDGDRVALREAFVDDVLSQALDEWRIRRGGILRWARGWYLQHDLTPTAPVLRDLPPMPTDED